LPIRLGRAAVKIAVKTAAKILALLEDHPSMTLAEVATQAAPGRR